MKKNINILPINQIFLGVIWLSFQNKFLITTADENTWKFDCPVIFLGEWCCAYNRKHIWQGMNSVIAKSYDPDDEKKNRLFKFNKTRGRYFPKALYFT